MDFEMELEKYLTKQAEARIVFLPADALKLCYQGVYGAEHLLKDVKKAEAFFMEEYAKTPPTNAPLWEEISPTYGRVHLGAWKKEGIPASWLFRLFLLTVEASAPPAPQIWGSVLSMLRRKAAKGELPFSGQAFEAFFAEYMQKGGGSVHHSDAYREKEKPAYRVVHRAFFPLFPILFRLASHFPNGGIIAIDGRAASGKTTLARRLSFLLEGSVVHMDDFFLPPQLRTAERLAQAGGNVHYERFAAEVLHKLKCKEEFTYTPFDCSKMDFGEPRTLENTPYRLVEGSYALHPVFGRYADLAVFSTVSPEEQAARIKVRNGAEMAEKFRTLWIPMEEKYFAAYGVREGADFVYQTEGEGSCLW